MINVDDDIIAVTEIKGISIDAISGITTRIRRTTDTCMTAVGRFDDINLPRGAHPMDLVDAIVSMSKPTQRFFRLLKTHRDGQTNICQVDTSQFTQQVLSKAYTELRKGNAVRRIRKSVYMINPELILVYPDYRETAQKTWELLE